MSTIKKQNKILLLLGLSFFILAVFFYLLTWRDILIMKTQNDFHANVRAFYDNNRSDIETVAKYISESKSHSFYLAETTIMAVNDGDGARTDLYNVDEIPESIKQVIRHLMIRSSDAIYIDSITWSDNANVFFDLEYGKDVPEIFLVYTPQESEIQVADAVERHSAIEDTWLIYYIIFIKG